jgi:hypothetical protein
MSIIFLWLDARFIEQKNLSPLLFIQPKGGLRLTLDAVILAGETPAQHTHMRNVLI